MSKNTNLSFLTDYITADITNGRIGINNASPSYAFDVTGQVRVTGSTTASAGIARGVYHTPTLIASANNDTLVGLDIAPTFTNGSFTGVNNYGLRVNGNIQLSSSGNSIVSYAGINLLTQSSAGVQLSNAVSGGYFRILPFQASFWALYTFGATGNTQINSGSTDLGYKFQVTGTTQFQGTTASDTAPLGSELAGVTGTGTNWALAGGATNLNVGGYTHTVGSTTALTTSLAAVVGTYYQITYTITGRTAGTITISYGGASKTDGGSSLFGPLATSTAVLTITPTTDFDGTIIVSIKTIGVSSASSTFANSIGTSSIEVRASSTTSNTFIGNNSGRRNTTGSDNVFIGQSAGLNNTTGALNTFIGSSSGALNNTGGYNSFIGYNAGTNNTTGGSNVFIGTLSGLNNTTGGSNTFIGQGAGQNNTTGGNNTFFGQGAGQSNTTASFNTAIGITALFSNTTSGGNIAIGTNSGRYIANGSTANTSTSQSIYIGENTKALADNQTNQIVIGNNSTGLGSNTTVLGNSSTLTTAIYGNLLLGSTTDSGYKLDVTGTARVSGQVNIGTSLAGYTTPSLLVNAGAGTAIPLQAIADSTGGRLFRFYTSDFNNTTTGTSIRLNFGAATGNTSANLQVYTGGEQVVAGTILALQPSGGNVGIGTSSPSGISTYTTLDIRGGTGGALRMGVTGSSTPFNLQQAGTDAYLNNVANGAMLLYTNDTERMRITSGGNVGIGMSAPAYKLEVNGTVYANSFLSASGFSYPAINTWTTFYTMPAEKGIFSVIIGLGQEDITIWFAYGTLFTQGSNAAFSTLANGTLVQLRTSGLNIQVLLLPGAGFTRELTFKVLRT